VGDRGQPSSSHQNAADPGRMGGRWFWQVGACLRSIWLTNSLRSQNIKGAERPRTTAKARARVEDWLEEPGRSIGPAFSVAESKECRLSRHGSAIRGIWPA